MILAPLLAVGRLLAVALVTAVVYPLWLLSLLLGLVSAAGAAAYQRALMGAWGRSTLRICGGRLEVVGRPPEPPFLLVSNHLSYVDILVIMATCRCRMLSKAEVARWPVIGLLARTSGTLFVERTRRGDLPRVIARIERLLGRGEGLVFFPEGTSTRGDRVLPFKPSVFEVAVRTGRPVSYASLHYATPDGSEPADMAVCWWGDMTFFRHLFHLLELPGFRARIQFGARPVSADDRKRLAELAHGAVAAQFTPVVGPSPR